MSALTTVYLDGELGARFGHEWKLAIKSPNEALSIINANVGGLFQWIRNNLEKFQNYIVACEHHGGTIEYLDSKESYLMLHNLKSIRFIPLVNGASAMARAISGVVLFVVGAVTGIQPLMFLGAQLALSGITELLAPKPKKTTNGGDSKNSHYFNGAENTVEQGAYVPLIYGKIKTGSQAISVALTVDEEI